MRLMLVGVMLVTVGLRFVVCGFGGTLHIWSCLLAVELVCPFACSLWLRFGFCVYVGVLVVCFGFVFCDLGVVVLLLLWGFWGDCLPVRWFAFVFITLELFFWGWLRIVCFFYSSVNYFLEFVWEWVCLVWVVCLLNIVLLIVYVFGVLLILLCVLIMIMFNSSGLHTALMVCCYY